MTDLTRSPEDLPLTGLRVVDWTQYGVGPFAGALLGQLGADVIHVEARPDGDPQMYRTPTVHGISALYIDFNTNKRSIQLDLRSEDDRLVMDGLLASSDVLLTNFKPTSLRRLGYAPEQVCDRYQHLVYCVTNGWGVDGPMSESGANDLMVQAFGGWASVTGTEGGRGETLRFLANIDLNTSLYAVAALLTALTSRHRRGGEVVYLSMLEATLAMQCTRLAEYFAGRTPVPTGSASTVVAPSEAFLCEDDAYIAVSAETQAQWVRLCSALGVEEFADRDAYASNQLRVQNRLQLSSELASVFREFPARWWQLQLRRSRVPHSTFWDPPLVEVHPQVRENSYLVEVDTGRCGIVLTGGVPWSFASSPCAITRNPYSDEHGDEIRRELATAPRRGVPSEAPSEAAVRLPLEGLRVLEVSTGLSGPYCGSLLADNGAEVLKLELEPDRVRDWVVDGQPALFDELNRNKRIVAGDQGQPLEDYLVDADVLILDGVSTDGEPLVPDLDRIRQDHPGLIVCVVSAYGPAGPYATDAGSELTVQAMANTWAGLGRMGEPPIRLGADQAMLNAGVTAYQAVLAALYRRDRTGGGDRCDVSALGTHLAVRGATYTCLSNPEQWPGLHLGGWTAPPEHGIRTADRPILMMLSRTDPNCTVGLFEALELKPPDGMDLQDRMFTEAHPNHPKWSEFWSEVFAHTACEDVVKLLRAHGGNAFPFMDYPALDTDAQVRHLGIFAEVPGATKGRVVRCPWTLSSHRLPSYKFAKEVPAGPEERWLRVATAVNP